MTSEIVGRRVNQAFHNVVVLSIHDVVTWTNCGGEASKVSKKRSDARR
jgi:hypothetical protein